MAAASVLNEAVKTVPTSKMQSVFKKYSSSKQDNVAKIPTRVIVDF